MYYISVNTKITHTKIITQLIIYYTLSQQILNAMKQTLHLLTEYVTIIRDGPFDIWGWGVAGIFPRDKLFFLCFCTTSYFFSKVKSKLQQVFYFFEKKHIKIRKM